MQQKRFRHTQVARSNASWPEPERTDGKFLLDPRRPFRHLVVMIDAELAEPGPKSLPITKDSLLSDLLDSRLVRTYRYADAGPPESVPPRPRTEGYGSDCDVYDGWVVTTQSESDRDTWLVRYPSGPESWTTSGVMGNAVHIAADDDVVDAYRHLDPDSARVQRKADGLAAQVASQGLSADLYVTERQYLHAATWDVARGVAVCSVGEALPLVGLYLRAQGDFRIASSFTTNRGLYYLVGARELLPAGWRWLRALVQHDEATGDLALSRLGSSLILRVERALEARDYLHVALNQPQHNDTRREIASRLDDVLVDLMGAADAAASVAHRVLGLSSNEVTAGWQKKSWLKEVAAKAAPLADVMGKGTSACHALTVLRLLRNSVHGTMLQSIALLEAMTPEQSLIEIPDAREAEILGAMSALGGEATWGIRRIMQGRVHLDPGAFVEALFPYVVQLLNNVMEKTPLEQLPNVSLIPADTLPPAPDSRNTHVWDEWVRTSVRWQLGF